MEHNCGHKTVLRQNLNFGCQDFDDSTGKMCRLKWPSLNSAVVDLVIWLQDNLLWVAP